MLTKADQCTLARLVIAPIIVVCYMTVPAAPAPWCFMVVSVLCGLAEWTDFMDGRIARARGEVSDFGKLADPFCDVIYRLAIFAVFLLPIGGYGYAVDTPTSVWWQPLTFAVTDGETIALRAGMVPFLPVLIMMLREIIAGALRSMAATKGLVLAARTSGKVKAWFQGVALVSISGLPYLTWGYMEWQWYYGIVMAWFCAALSALSITEYMWVNRSVLVQLAMRKPMPTTETPHS